ncbi:uncharacterized protein [Heptranchias perlo]|uniref:uncharacterized protein n=1 Tax=Heptranchias perlo TaxID=212740 RepID=UPI00355944DB
MPPLCKELMGYYQDLEKEPDEPQTLTTVKKKRQKFQPHRGPLGSAKLHNITKSLDKTEMELLIQQASQLCPEEQPVSPCKVYRMPSYFQNILKIQNSRPPVNNSMTFDEFGNVISVRKLKPSRFPRHQVRPRFQLVDADLETEGGKLAAAQAVRPLVFRSGNFGKMFIPARYNVRRTRQKGPQSRGSPGTLVGIGGSNAVKAAPAPAVHGLKLSDSCAVSTTPEFMEFVPDGIKDRNRSACGRCPEYEEVEQGRLRPICKNLFIPPIPVAKLLQSHISHVRLSSELTSSAVQ